ncbi:hypothetical protein AOT96_27285 [Rhodococcus sp. 008]|nr:hypothetical protein AOT96_27285 [Rhodococcus sp. 008]
MTITITKAGETAKDARSFEVYMTDDDVKALVANLEDDDEHLYQDKASRSTATAASVARKSSGSGELDQFKDSLRKHLDVAKQLNASREQDWFKTKWTNTSEAKPVLAEIIGHASDADLKRIAQVSTPEDREKLITILNGSKSTVNASILKIARELMNEEVPS